MRPSIFAVIRAALVPTAGVIFFALLLLVLLASCASDSAVAPIPQLDYGSCQSAVPGIRTLYGAPADSEQAQPQQVVWFYARHDRRRGDPPTVWFAGEHPVCQVVRSDY